jgi:hypothetical protein
VRQVSSAVAITPWGCSATRRACVGFVSRLRCMEAGWAKSRRLATLQKTLEYTEGNTGYNESNCMRDGAARALGITPRDRIRHTL